MKNRSHSFTRREALYVIAGAALGGGAGILRAEPVRLPHLTDANPAAASLAYTDDSASVDGRHHPDHESDQRCANCRYFDVATLAPDGYGPCRLYPGNSVSAKGWCAGYTRR